MATACDLTMRVDDAMAVRNRQCEAFFAREADRLASACRELAGRFQRGGRLLAFGRGASATDAQHVAVEFVHPVIVGKRALPALDLSTAFERWLDVVLRPDDSVMGFGPPGGDERVQAALARAARRGAMTWALPGTGASYDVATVDDDPFVHQEIIEVLYHTVWETVHVFLERETLGHDVGQAGFLYPFLGRDASTAPPALAEVAESIRMKAADDSRLRTEVARGQAAALVAAARLIRARVDSGGQLIVFGNGGSATDATDFALDCIAPPTGAHPIPAVSLALDAANVTAIANDVGADVIFLRQLIALARPGDVAVAFSTSGGSRNIVMALEEARKRGLQTVAFLGYDGGEIGRRALADVPLIVGCDYIPRIQEIHASMYHVLRDLIEAVAHA
jgi:D-sedoheptulose 7-phosphate isomerase